MSCGCCGSLATRAAARSTVTAGYARAALAYILTSHPRVQSPGSPSFDSGSEGPLRLTSEPSDHVGGAYGKRGAAAGAGRGGHPALTVERWRALACRAHTSTLFNTYLNTPPR